LSTLNLLGCLTSTAVLDLTADEVRRRRKIIKKKNSDLLKFVEPNFELVDNLRTKDVFSAEVIEDIEAEKTKTRRVEKILYHLRYVDEDGYKSFLEALRDSSQMHIVNFINGTPYITLIY